MSRFWGQEERPGWFASIVRALALSAVVAVGIGMYLNAKVWTPLQRYYWNEYLNSDDGRQLEFPTDDKQNPRSNDS